MRPGLDAIEEFRLSDEEAFTVSLTKLWLMEEDRLHDPDPPDQEAKHGPCLQYALELHRAFQLELVEDDSNVPKNDAQSIAAAAGSEDWVRLARRALGDLDFDGFRKVATDRRLIQAALRTIERRSRAVVVSVEVAAFFPWDPKVKFEKSVRHDRLTWVAGQLPRMTPDYLWELDRELTRRARKLALRNLNWRKMGLVAAGGAILGLITGGLAAPLIGGFVGTTALGLSGAAAVNGGLALLGGGSLAAGGMGVAGGTLVVTGAAGFGAGSLAAGGATLHGLSGSGVLADMVKLDVLTDYYFLRELREPEKARKVIELTQQRLERVEEAHRTLQEQVDELVREKDAMLDAAHDVIEERDQQIAELEERLEASEEIRKTMGSELKRLSRRVGESEALANG